MTGLLLQKIADLTEVRRWTLSAGFVVFMHIAVLAAGVFWFTRHNDFAGTGSQPMMVDLESAPPTDKPREFDVAPGPEMQQAPAPTPEQEQRTKAEQEQIQPAPLQQNPLTAAPPEQKEKPKPVQDKPIAAKPPQPAEPAAPRTTAPAQAAEAARANYNGLLSAHLQRFKQYPPASRAKGEQGVAMLNFTVSRNGRVLDSSVAKSSGSTALDSETVAMVRRAQPLPSFPPEMTQDSITVTVPIRYSLR